MRKEDKLQITKDKLINAAHDLMNSCVDPSEVTSRAIADRADVKLSMINYCFGSREALLFEALKKDEEIYLQDTQIRKVFNSKIAPKEKIRRLHYLVADYLINRFKFTKALTGYVLHNRDLQEGLNTLPLVREHYKVTKEEWEIKLIAYQLSSMMQLIIYRMEDMSDFLEVDIRKEIRKIIDLQIDLLLEDNP